ncbi:hypothetical protein E2C01_042293 [Portunus trituberculatus]|uniref:Uncharacterized protein n=1 Tax=Portunus trituberculatus TaxID=210409 RepID=A0A5B7FTA6_PORTR|nr:hypothetical protein [Portunus trituberculatus]
MHSRFVYSQWKLKSGVKLVIIDSLNENSLNKGFSRNVTPSLSGITCIYTYTDIHLHLLIKIP